MAKTCIRTTIGGLSEAISAHDGSDGTREVLEKLQKLVGNMPITVCSGTEKSSSRGKSKYNIFISSCMKEKTGPVTERMKVCAAEWRKKK